MVENKTNDGMKQIFESLGTILGTLHAKFVIHGDLTTSNILIDPKDQRSIHLIDFGLAQVNVHSSEDMGVDIYVLERSLCSTHGDTTDLFAALVHNYSILCPAGAAKYEQVIRRRIDEMGDNVKEILIERLKRSLECKDGTRCKNFIGAYSRKTKNSNGAALIDFCSRFDLFVEDGI
ncbi:EKC/KEOPS complex subunit TP53RK-like [Octopus sinensis]|uniref:non-specific serine/threonine protein kinase n=1 Tax=Octopus sinensis TaxID=2607531 RepID=A0A6P7TWZ4_9MOLL|nr:EKC/KEOPS complex subunit TP53RK-like [Octopus sinensis]